MTVKNFQVADLARAVAFYTHNLGFELLQTEADSATLSAGVDTVHLSLVAEVTPSTQRVWVSDAEALLPMVLATGAAPAKTKVKWQHWGTREFPVADVDGNVLTLCSASIT